MRIAVVNLTGGGLSGGYRKYLKRLLPELARQPGVQRLDSFAPAAAEVDLSHTCDDVRFVAWPSTAAPASWLRSRITRSDYDLVFIPTARCIRLDGLPVVSMVRNMEPLVTPFEGHRLLDAARNGARRWTAQRAVSRATRVIAVSQFVADWLRLNWRVPSSRIGIVPHGVDAVIPLLEPPLSLASLVGRPFLFTAGSIRPARGLEDILDALPRLSNAFGNTLLVIAGTADSGTLDYMRRMTILANQLGIAHRLLWVGRLDEQAMTWAYQHAAAFVMTSRVEACPNIVLEALAAGAVSVSTNSPPMPEFFGGVASYYSARDSVHLASVLNEVLALSSTNRATRVLQAQRRASMYTWEATAAGTLQQLRQAMSQ